MVRVSGDRPAGPLRLDRRRRRRRRQVWVAAPSRPTGGAGGRRSDSAHRGTLWRPSDPLTGRGGGRGDDAHRPRPILWEALPPPSAESSAPGCCLSVGRPQREWSCAAAAPRPSPPPGSGAHYVAITRPARYKRHHHRRHCRAITPTAPLGRRPAHWPKWTGAAPDTAGIHPNQWKGV